MHFDDVLQHILRPLAICCLVGKQSCRTSHAEERVWNLLVSISSSIPEVALRRLSRHSWKFYYDLFTMLKLLSRTVGLIEDVLYQETTAPKFEKNPKFKVI